MYIMHISLFIVEIKMFILHFKYLLAVTDLIDLVKRLRMLSLHYLCTTDDLADGRAGARPHNHAACLVVHLFHGMLKNIPHLGAGLNLSEIIDKNHYTWY